MKKLILTLVAAGVLALALVACGNKDGDIRALIQEVDSCMAHAMSAMPMMVGLAFAGGDTEAAMEAHMAGGCDMDELARQGQELCADDEPRCCAIFREELDAGNLPSVASFVVMAAAFSDEPLTIDNLFSD